MPVPQPRPHFPGTWVSWRDDRNRWHKTEATPTMPPDPFRTASRAYATNTFKNRKATQGFYWFAQTGKHVWHESMTRYTALMILDHTDVIKTVTAHPMRLQFQDGTEHHPSYFFERTNGQAGLLDVVGRLKEDSAEYLHTMEMCEEIGWSFLVFPGIERVARYNLEWIAGFRHPRFRPDPEWAQTILDVCQRPAPFRVLFDEAKKRRHAAALPGIYNMLWQGAVEIDESRRFTMSTLVRRPQ